VYVQNTNADEFNPHKTLAAFERVSLQPGEKKTVSFTISKDQLSSVTEQGQKVVKPGEYAISVGGAQPSTERIQNGSVAQKQIKLSGEISKI
jgi:beta-glucosidase